MNKQQQIESYQEIQQYLQKNKVYDIFGRLTQEIILQKPANVLDFIIKSLQVSEKFTLFIVGPPGLSINNIIRKVMTSFDKKLELFNSGEEISKKINNLNAEQKQKFQSLLLINEESMTDIINSIEQHAKSDNNYIIQGFPKNLKQAHLLQKRQIYTKNVLFINIDLGNLYKLISNKMTLANPKKSQDQIQFLTKNAMIQHTINTNELKKFYNKYMQIDLSKSIEQEYIAKQLTKAFSLKTIQPLPRISSQILIVGAPNSGRTTLGKKIAAHYNFIYISTSFLIAEEIRKDTIHGRKIKSQFINKQMIDTFLIEKLIQERVASTDCKMQGFVIEGYPKNQEQYDNVKDMKLSPSMIVAIDTPMEHSKSRNTLSEQKFAARYTKWATLVEHLHSTKDNIFWVNPYLNVSNMYEEVIHEFEKQFT